MSDESPFNTVLKYSWLFSFLVSLLIILGGFFVLTGVDPVEFEDSTGTNWNSFANSNSAIADYIIRLERLVGIASLTIGAFFAYLSFGYLKNQEKWAWYVMWLLPFALIGWSIIFFLNNALLLSSYYILLFGLATVGQLIPIKSYI